MSEMTKDEERFMWKLMGALLLSSLVGSCLAYLCDLQDAIFTCTLLICFFYSALWISADDIKKQRTKKGLKLWRREELDDLEKRIEALEEKSR